MSGTEHRPQGTPALHAAGDVSMGGSRPYTGRFPRDSDRARSPTELQLSTAKQNATTLIDGNLSRLQLQKLSRRPISEVTEERARCGPLMQISMYVRTHARRASHEGQKRISGGRRADDVFLHTSLETHIGSFPTANIIMLIHTVYRFFSEQEHFVHPLGTERCVLCRAEAAAGAGAGQSGRASPQAALTASSSRAARQRFWRCPEED